MFNIKIYFKLLLCTLKCTNNHCMYAGGTKAHDGLDFIVSGLSIKQNTLG